jgi:glycine cleavage system H protein
MSEIPSDLKYSQTHEWIEVSHDGIATVGITDHAQEMLGDIVFVEAPEVGSSIAIEEACGVVESVKAASDLYAPISGEVTEINEDLADTPESINTGPFADGWIYRVKITDTTEVDQLMNADEYAEFIESEEH